MGGPEGCPPGRWRRETGDGVSAQPRSGHALTSASGVRFGGLLYITDLTLVIFCFLQNFGILNSS